MVARAVSARAARRPRRGCRRQRTYAALRAYLPSLTLANRDKLYLASVKRSPPAARQTNSCAGNPTETPDTCHKLPAWLVCGDRLTARRLFSPQQVRQPLFALTRDDEVIDQNLLTMRQARERLNCNHRTLRRALAAAGVMLYQSPTDKRVLLVSAADLDHLSKPRPISRPTKGGMPSPNVAT